MFWIDNPSRDPAYNLALEEVLLNAVEPGHPGFGILWQNEPAVVAGRFQNVLQEVDMEQIRARNIHVARRMTGGGTVYHDAGTLNYTFIHSLDVAGSLPSFSECGMPIAEALRGLGLPVDFSGRNDLMLHGSKVAGVAHCRQRDRFLHHGCLLIACDLDMLGQVLKPDPEKFLSKGVTSVRSRVTNLNEHANISVDAVRASIMDFCKAESIPLVQKFMDEAMQLREKKYACDDWTFGASPPFSEYKKHRFPWGKLEAMLDVRQGHIAACKLYGDVFGDLARLEKLLTGVKYSRCALSEILLANPPQMFIDGSSTEALLEFFTPGN